MNIIIKAGLLMAVIAAHSYSFGMLNLRGGGQPVAKGIAFDHIRDRKKNEALGGSFFTKDLLVNEISSRCDTNSKNNLSATCKKLRETVGSSERGIVLKRVKVFGPYLNGESVWLNFNDEKNKIAALLCVPNHNDLAIPVEQLKIYCAMNKIAYKSCDPTWEEIESFIDGNNKLCVAAFDFAVERGKKDIVQRMLNAHANLELHEANKLRLKALASIYKNNRDGEKDFDCIVSGLVDALVDSGSKIDDSYWSIWRVVEREIEQKNGRHINEEKPLRLRGYCIERQKEKDNKESCIIS